MTNASAEMTFFSEPLLCGPSPGQWAAMAGWPVLLLGIIVLLVNVCRQIALLKRPDGRFISERVSTVGIATGWLSFIAGIGMTWYGLHSTWLVGAMGGFPDQGLLLLSYAQASIPGFIGILILSGAHFEAYVFKYLWMRKIKTEHNQAPEDTARKLADPQR